MAKCKGLLAYEVLAGMRVYREENGQKVYRARCTVCKHNLETNGKIKKCPQDKENS